MKAILVEARNANRADPVVAALAVSSVRMVVWSADPMQRRSKKSAMGSTMIAIRALTKYQGSASSAPWARVPVRELELSNVKMASVWYAMPSPDSRLPRPAMGSMTTAMGESMRIIRALVAPARQSKSVYAESVRWPVDGALSCQQSEPSQ